MCHTENKTAAKAAVPSGAAALFFPSKNIKRFLFFKLLFRKRHYDVITVREMRRIISYFTFIVTKKEVIV